MKYQHYNTKKDEYETLEADYVIHKGEPASMSGHPDSWHDGTAPEMELVIINVAGVDVTDTLDQETLDRIEKLCWAEAEQEREDF